MRLIIYGRAAKMCFFIWTKWTTSFPLWNTLISAALFLICHTDLRHLWISTDMQMAKLDGRPLPRETSTTGTAARFCYFRWTTCQSAVGKRKEILMAGNVQHLPTVASASFTLFHTTLLTSFIFKCLRRQPIRECHLTILPFKPWVWNICKHWLLPGWSNTSMLPVYSVLLHTTKSL